MKLIQKIFTRGADDYVKQFGSDMPAVQRKALMAIESCRTERLGTNIFGCSFCGKTEVFHRSCANRHCPVCQADKGAQWFETHHKKMLPASYFMITFTVPEKMRRPIRSNQSALYDALFRCAWQSMALLAKDPRHLGAHTLGAIGVLHTWTRQLEYHPHIHFLVPAGGLDKQGQWVHGRQDFFLPVRALSRIFRAKMRDALRDLNLLYLVEEDVWKNEWNVNCENKGNGMYALSYLSNYLFRVAISNSRIVRTDAQTTTFRYKKQKSDKSKNCTLSTTEFIRRFLQHVLPKGFVKVRHFGFCAAHGTQRLAHIAEMIMEGFRCQPPPPAALQYKPHGVRCSCGTQMKLVAFVHPSLREATLVQT
jgi:hypothetical protein